MPADDDELLEADEVIVEPGAAPLAQDRRPGPVVHDRAALPVVAQAAVLATAGFAAGAVTAAVVRSAATRRRARRRPRTQVVATRSFLIDVHVLQPRD